MTIFGIAVGGAVGSILRYLVQIQCTHWFGSRFPLGTLIINTIGSLLIGFLFIVLLERYSVSSEIRLALMTGLLGGFTTFSAFSLETIDLIQQGSFLSAASNIILSVVLCLTACYLGVILARTV
ncbi:MAG: fluoride efflux transporter CrcB [Gammaproteobacteria bacterium]|nr:fluoride efflux transporter CrcB [Gammaproteobacteria bacterium]